MPTSAQWVSPLREIPASTHTLEAGVRSRLARMVPSAIDWLSGPAADTSKVRVGLSGRGAGNPPFPPVSGEGAILG